jgi:outer membrane receptor protein involved in Fe transport
VYGTLGPEFYIDLNYQIKDALFRGLDFNVYVTNLLNNQDRIGLVVNIGTYRPLGRTIGTGISYSF